MTNIKKINDHIHRKDKYNEERNEDMISDNMEEAKQWARNQKQSLANKLL